MADYDSQLPVRSDDATKFNATVVGNGTAGAPDAGVMTVQGDPAMTPLLVTITNPDNADVNGVPVGTQRIGDFGQENAAANAAAASPIATVAITAGKDGYIRSVKGSGSGLGKFELVAGANFGAATAIAPAFYTSAANLNGDWKFDPPIPVAGGTNVYLKGTNRDNSAQDLSGSIDGYETL